MTLLKKAIFFYILCPAYFCCEPLYPVISITSGNIVFAHYLFPVVVLLKYRVFRLSCKLNGWTIFLAFLLANIISSIIGLALGSFIAAVPLDTVWLSIILVLPILNSNLKKHGPFKNIPKSVFLLIILFAALLSSFGFTLARGIQNQNLLVYFSIKTIAAIMTFFASFIIAVAYEEAVVSIVHRLIKKQTQDFTTAIYRSNVFGFGLVFGIGALIGLYHRFLSPTGLLPPVN